jgi:hypothetical protein
VSHNSLISSSPIKTKTNSVALSPQANYTDWATAITHKTAINFRWRRTYIRRNTQLLEWKYGCKSNSSIYIFIYTYILLNVTSSAGQLQWVCKSWQTAITWLSHENPGRNSCWPSNIQSFVSHISSHITSLIIKNKTKSVTFSPKLIIPTKRPPLSDEVSSTFYR